ncbi:COX15/CtaA family protein [Lutimonas saemankumensis]|uniref:COX15/CtaA family protein n=1 Tax=Lutimonas saemankumensis TaxID=483016 RepID=UPI001CD52116|nr:COX15/CtaA family protein [Lutimonas saemankumensis]MCA0932400.1 COX15/CtaA family protein [Lutimonas saemankumensis]
MKKQYLYTKTIRFWLLTGLIMLIGQVILGGITRLTGSGLSITSWDIITGVIPPLNKADWLEAFELYKQTPQFHKLNSDFTLKQFKFIYFWEYFHRLWVRALGIIFLIPFVVFLIRKQIDTFLVKRLLLVVVLAGLTASAGWIMVMSGLVDRPWVNAYKLTLHFLLAIATIGAMVKCIADVYLMENKPKKGHTKFVMILLAFTTVQLVFAGLMAGMRAGLYYATWPSMNGTFIPAVLLDASNWTWDNMTNYDTFSFAPALVQFVHRILAYIILALTVYYYHKKRNHVHTSAIKWLTVSYVLVVFQVFLGIMTLLKIKTGIPLVYGTLHQLVGLLYVISLLFLYYSLRKKISIWSKKKLPQG